MLTALPPDLHQEHPADATAFPADADRQRLRAALRHSRLLVYNCDTELRYTWIANPAKFFTPERLIGRRDDELTDPANVADLIRLKREVLESGVPAGRELLLVVGGETRWYEAHAEPLLDESGAVVGLTVSAMDITDRRRAEEERQRLLADLEAERSLLRAVTEQMPAGLIVAEGPSGRIVTYNRMAELILGHPAIPGEGIGDYGAFGGLHPDGRPFAPEEYPTARALLRGEPVHQQEFQYRRGDGTLTHISVSAAPLWRPDDPPDGPPAAAVCAFVDVSARRRAEAELREAEARLQLAQEVGGIGSWEYDTVTGQGHWSPSTFRLYGRDPETWRPSFEGWQSCIHPEDRERARAAVSRIVMEKVPLDHEFRVVMPDGSVRWVLSRNRPEMDAQGNLLRIRGSDIDITERRQTEAALQESEARFRDMADGAPVMVWVTDASGHCTYLNRAWCEFTGQTEEQGHGLGWLDATHPDDKEMAERIFLDANARRAPFRVEYRLRRADGAYRWTIDAAAPRFGADGEYLGYVGSVIDITEHKEAEAALREGEERFRTMANLIPSLIWLGDPEGNITYLNDRWYEYSGQTPETAMPSGWFDTVHPDDQPVVTERWTSALRSGAPYSLDIRFRRHDGVYRWYVARALPLRGADGRITGWFGIDTDIHDLKVAQEELTLLNASLEERVRAEVEERQRAQAALLQAQKVEALGQLTGGVAHDFNNLLQAISGCLHLVERRTAGNAQVKPLLEAGYQAVDRGSKLVQQLLTFARRQQLHPEPVAIRDRVLAMNDLLTRALRADIHLELDFEPGLWTAEVDALQFELALINLTVNARDAMPEGGRLRISAVNERLPPGHPSGLTGEFVRISVADTGSGMPPAVAARAFDPFFTTKEVGKGTGLGLSQVYGLASQSGGTAWIDTAPGMGTTVTMLLRRTEESVRADAAGSAALSGTARSGRVMLVEDDPIVAATVSASLEEAGYTVLRCPTADAALERLATEPVDLVFSDVVMPGEMSGVDLANAVKRRFPTLPVILSTGYSEEVARTPGVQVLGKPYQLSDLVRMVERALAVRV